jgi:hypothetical protein
MPTIIRETLSKPTMTVVLYKSVVSVAGNCAAIFCVGRQSAGPPSSLSGETSRRIRPDGDRGRATNPGRVDMAGDGEEDTRGVGGSFLA